MDCGQNYSNYMEYGKMFKKGILSLFFALFLFTGLAFAADKVNVNTASVEQLQSVKGFGSATAKAIIEFREEHGSFETVDDLVLVKGIGNKKLEKVSDQLSVTDSK